jgi:NAD-dependent SIR2 family protein deacetylase
MVTQIKELPGGLGEAHACLYCGKLYPIRDYEKDTPLDTPSQCRRCGSPMDEAAARKFADSQAIEHQQNWPHLRARASE